MLKVYEMKLFLSMLTVSSILAGASPLFATEHHFTAYITGYSYWDNTPPGSTEISHPEDHRYAGGTGTYHDPITLAVGHSIERGKETLDFPPGTMFYIRRLKKYAIVEDTCGDGNRPQDGPCHTGARGHPWFDLYVGGKHSGNSVSNRCMDLITAVQMVIMNPKPHYEVAVGEVVDDGCRVF